MFGIIKKGLARPAERMVDFMTAKQFYNFHRSQFDTWEHGEIKKTWIDENGNVCIMYQSGKWWHYKNKDGKVIFW